MASNDQTFGLEVELLCLLPPPHLRAPQLLPYPHIVDALYTIFSNSGIPISNPDPEAIDPPAAPYSRWRVEEEVLSLTAEEAALMEQAGLIEQGWTVEPVELASRKFSYYHDDWRSEVAAVLTALRELEKFGVKFLTNISTGMHVHVGFHDRFVPLTTAKRVLQLATAFEHLLDRVHAVSRTTIPWEKEERHHCFPPSFFHIKNPTAVGANVFDRLRRVQAVATYEELGAFFVVAEDQMRGGEPTTGHNSAYNFDTLFADLEVDRHVEDLTGTVEFRQHAGTLSLDAILAWVDLTTAVVRFAEEVGEGKFLDLLALDDLLTTLEIPLAAYTHFTTLPHPQQELFVPNPFLTPLIPLLLANQRANEDDNGEEAKAGVVEGKFEIGIYGRALHATVIEWPENVGSQLLRQQERSSGVIDLGAALEWLGREFDRVVVAARGRGSIG